MFMKQKKPSFYFPKILVALVFLLTPSISLIDPLPDFIGYLLLAHALSYAADAFPYFGDAKAGFTRMMWISLSKIPAALLMLMMWGTDNAQRSIVTVFSLCYAVLDLVFLMPALRSFMEGVFYLGNRYDCESAMGVPASFGKMTREQFKKLLFTFFVAKEIMCFLPELSLISVKQYSPDYVLVGSPIVWSTYYPLFAFVGAVLILCFGMIVLAYAFRYFLYLKNAGEMEALLQSRFTDEADYLYEKREYSKVATGLLLLLAAVGLSIDFILDDVNVLPDIISIVLFIVGIAMLRPILKGIKIPALLFSLYGGVSLYGNLVKTSFVTKYSYRMIETNTAAANLYTHYSIAFLVETILACLAFASLFGIMKIAYAKYAPKAFEGNEKKLKMRLFAFVGLGCLSAIGSLLYVLSMRYTKPVETAVDEVIGVLVFPKWEWFWMVPLVLALVWLGYSIGFIGQLRDTVKNKAEW